MRGNSTTTGFGTAARLVALAALVCFQLAYAGHESQHAAGDLAESCAACAHLDQNAPTAPDAVPCTTDLPARHTNPATGIAIPAAAGRSGHAIRAPPRS